MDGTAEPITPQTDIYSLGVMMFEILTGQLPFEAPTPIALMFKHVHEPVPTVRTQRPDLSGLPEPLYCACAG